MINTTRVRMDASDYKLCILCSRYGENRKMIEKVIQQTAIYFHKECLEKTGLLGIAQFVIRVQL